MALGSIASAPPPSQTAALTSSAVFDNSGWAVNVGSGAATSEKTALPSAGETVKAVASGFGGLLNNPAFLVLVGVGLFLYLKHK